ncbi:hypothetical protein [Streptomyces rugosispiralis]|uniref:Uncharacterized protein n=1 Tax=Streptomyces rugosispiralis TaxID=2967341 RepID=A0ABT1UZX7_9ACTN|nr:hypothetical protein [Streptomyces rugosispiralis]MCQ8190684.1 hypothetical protein [Streptomyces rugosispiralis]
MNPEADIGRLRDEASREDYASMARLARALYASGLGSREVLREAYGTGFPEEVFVLVGAGLSTLDLLAYFTHQPWQLAVPPEQGGPQEVPGPLAETEQLVLALDPGLLPLVQIPAATSAGDDRIVCYRFEELRAGLPTAFSLRAEPYPYSELRDTEAVRCGESLLAVLDEVHADDVRRLEGELHQPWNRGAGSVDRGEVEQAHASLELVRRLRRQATGRQEG